jgi:hypothetical protein
MYTEDQQRNRYQQNFLDSGHELYHHISLAISKRKVCEVLTHAMQ